MTNEQKEQVLDLRSRGFSYVEIGEVVGLPVNTIKTFCWRNKQPTDGETDSLLDNITDSETDNIPAHSPTENLPLYQKNQPLYQDGMCRQCGIILNQPSKTKPRFFCGAKCRSAWRYRHRSSQDKKSTAITCARCGKQFYAYGTNQRKYCGHSCYMQDRFIGGPHIDKRAV